VPALDKSALADAAVRVVKVTYWLGNFAASGRVVFEAIGDSKLVQCARAQYVEDQYRVMCRDGASGFANDLRVGNLARVADGADAIDDITRILRQRVVHRGLIIGPTAVIVDTETAADIDVL
jgi:hypothetical protein